MDRLRELGDWMKYNGEAIYGTRPVAPYREGRVCFTRKGDAVYLIQLARNAQVRPPRQVAVSSIQPAEGAEVTLLGREDVKIEWEKRGDGMVITVPWSISCPLRGERPRCRHAWAFKISRAIVHSENENSSGL
jgi:alpha-L-fucosidase